MQERIDAEFKTDTDLNDGGRAALVETMGFDPAQQSDLPKRDKLQIEADTPIELEYESGRPITTEFGDTNMFLFKQGGKDVVYFSKSKRLLFGILRAKLMPGNKFRLTKTGVGTDISYKVERL